MARIWAAEYISLIFSIITLPFYCHVIHVVYCFNKTNKRGHAFYTIILINGYADVVSLLNSYFCYMFPRWAWMMDFYQWSGNTLIRIGFFLSWSCATMQAQSTFMLGINRFMSIRNPGSTDKRWYNSGRFVTLFIILPGIAMGCALQLSAVGYMETDEGGLVPKLTTPVVKEIFFSFVGAVMCLYSLVLIFMYSEIWRVVRRQRSIYESRGQVHLREVIQTRRERKLLVMSMLICAAQVGVTSYLAYKSLRGVDKELKVYTLISIFYSGINPYLIVCFSDILRAKVFRFCLLPLSLMLKLAIPSSTTVRVIVASKRTMSVRLHGAVPMHKLWMTTTAPMGIREGQQTASRKTNSSV